MVVVISDGPLVGCCYFLETSESIEGFFLEACCHFWVPPGCSKHETYQKGLGPSDPHICHLPGGCRCSKIIPWRQSWPSADKKQLSTDCGERSETGWKPTAVTVLCYLQYQHRLARRVRGKADWTRISMWRSSGVPSAFDRQREEVARRRPQVALFPPFSLQVCPCPRPRGCVQWPPPVPWDGLTPWSLGWDPLTPWPPQSHQRPGLEKANALGWAIRSDFVSLPKGVVSQNCRRHSAVLLAAPAACRWGCVQQRGHFPAGGIA